jgi:hypothetical protein
MKNQIRHLFTEHPESVGETYSEHLRVALTLSLRLLAAGIMCAVHALAPWLFTTSASRAVTRVYQDMLARRGVSTERSSTRLEHATNHS